MKMSNDNKCLTLIDSYRIRCVAGEPSPKTCYPFEMTYQELNSQKPPTTDVWFFTGKNLK